MTRQNNKGKRFEALVSRADEALELEFHLEASWIVYSLIEERLKSLAIEKLSLNMHRDNFHSCIQSLLNERENFVIVKENLSEELLNSLDQWRLMRNNIMHDLAKEDIDNEKIKTLAIDGRKLFAELAASLMRIKKGLA